ncbi:MAG: hypothetical protein ISR76_11065 [Planctomycetes bacterium]|nr:hypothetical protein [Planctomycetota bacterium]MBL7009531.1 hypothetical protein [Planctomycetota bacterium]
MVQLANPTGCPDCGSGQVARILYGTIFDEISLERELAAGRAVLGGSWVKHAPKWECQGCNHRWGGAPATEKALLIHRDRPTLRRKILDLLGEQN